MTRSRCITVATLVVTAAVVSASRVFAQAAPSDPWRYVPPLATTCFAGDDFPDKLNAASTGSVAVYSPTTRKFAATTFTSSLNVIAIVSAPPTGTVRSCSPLPSWASNEYGACVDTEPLIVTFVTRGAAPNATSGIALPMPPRPRCHAPPSGCQSSQAA